MQKGKDMEHYNGMVVCIECGRYSSYTLGKVYEFVDGRVTDDRGEAFPKEPVKTLEEWNNRVISRAKFAQIMRS